MSTCLFSARLMAGQVTTFFGYSRGLNGALAAKPFGTPEMRNKQADRSTRRIIERIVDGTITCERVAIGGFILYSLNIRITGER